MDRVHVEPLGLGCPLFADEFVRCQTLQGFESASVVVGVDEVGQMLLQLCVIVVVEAFDSGFLDGPVHPLDLPVGPGMLNLGQAMFDAVLLADATDRAARRRSGRNCGW